MAALKLASLVWKRGDSDENGGLNNVDGDDSGQFSNSDDNDDYDGNYNWWWSPTGMAVRYSIVVGLLVIFTVFFVGGYWHAQRRIRRGLPPLRYHAWMVRRSAYRQPAYNPYPPQGAYPQQEYSNYGGGYPMEGYQQQPPPAYNNHTHPPPAYQPPPPGATKAMANQNYMPVHRAEDEAEGSSSQAVASPTPAVAARP